MENLLCGIEYPVRGQLGEYFFDYYFIKDCNISHALGHGEGSWSVIVRAVISVLVYPKIHSWTACRVCLLACLARCGEA